MPESVLQFAGLIAIATMFVLCVILSLDRNTKLFIVVGQSVFAWLACIVGMILLTRIFVGFDLVATDYARAINSITFIGSVLGIVVTVLKHGRANQ